jgi:hypothetical protein
MADAGASTPVEETTSRQTLDEQVTELRGQVDSLTSKNKSLRQSISKKDSTTAELATMRDQFDTVLSALSKNEAFEDSRDELDSARVTARRESIANQVADSTAAAIEEILTKAELDLDDPVMAPAKVAYEAGEYGKAQYLTTLAAMDHVRSGNTPGEQEVTALIDKRVRESGVLGADKGSGSPPPPTPTAEQDIEQLTKYTPGVAWDYKEMVRQKERITASLLEKSKE